MSAAPKLTRQQFINAYLRRSGLELYRTPDGYAVAGERGLYQFTALPCACGADNCEGWAMVSAGTVETHRELYLPPAEQLNAELTDYQDRKDLASRLSNRLLLALIAVATLATLAHAWWSWP